MRKLITILFLCLLPLLIEAQTTYYVSATGSDANNGTSTSTPWQTIAKVNALTKVAGDQILFKRGDTFYGSLSINQSGSSFSNPITIGAYGTGNDPVITGFQTLSSWTDNTGGVWYANVDSNNTMIALLDGNIVYMGRTPYYYYQSHSGSNQITSSSIGAINWTGANIVMRNVAWIIDIMPITAQSGGTITFDKNAYTRGVLDYYNPINGGWFFIQNDLRTLDSLGEWYSNAGKFYMYFGASNPSAHSIKISTQNYNINLNSSYYIKVQDIKLEGASYSAINIKDNFGVVIQNVTSDNQGGYFLYGSMMNGLVTNCNVTNSLAGAFHVNLGSSNYKFLTVKRSALSPGNHFSGDGFGSGIGITGSNDTISNCTVVNSGYEGISVSGNNALVQYNRVDSLNFIKSDGGAIYVSNSLYSNTKIKHNIVSNGFSPPFDTDPSGTIGIYMDNGARDGYVIGNTVFNINTAGMYMQYNGYRWQIDSNTVYGKGDQGEIRFAGSENTAYGHNAILRHNVVVSTDASMPVLSLEYANNNQKDSLFNIADSNFYLRPIANDGSMIALDSQYKVAAVNYSYILSQWKSLSGKDASSVGSPKYITSPDSMILVYNPTMSDSTVSLAHKYISAKGVTYDGSITLAPFTSEVLIQNGSSSSVAAPTISLSGNQNITVSSTTVFATPVWASGHSGTVLWTKTSGPGSALIGSPNSTSTGISGLVNGTYVFRCTATQDDSQTAYAEVTVMVNIPVSVQKIKLRSRWKFKNQ